MRDFFLYVLFLFLAICIIRIGYGLGANTISYSLNYFLQSLPDVREDFSVFIDTLGSFTEAILQIKVSFEEGADVLTVLQAIWNYFTALFAVLASLVEGTYYFLLDLMRFSQMMFELLFGVAVDPIEIPKP